MGTLDFVTKRKLAKTTTAETTYAALVRKVGRGEKLGHAEEEALANAIEATGRSVEQAEADAGNIAEAARLAREAEQLPEARKAVARAVAAADAHHAETLKILEARDATAGTLMFTLTSAQALEAALTAAAARLADLRRENWQLLQAPDPAIAARRRYVTLDASGPSERDGVPIVRILVALGTHGVMQQHGPTWPEEVEWVPLPGQSAAEVRELAALAVRLFTPNRGSTPVRFLVAEGADALSIVGHCSINVNATADLPSRTAYAITRRPGQTPAEFADLLAKYTARTAADAARFTNCNVQVLNWEVGR